MSTQFLDELRARTTLSAVIAPSVKLVKAGREYKACCPFHSEKTPSFTVNDEKGFYHCLAGETVVPTRGGRVPIASLAGSLVDVLTRGGQWVPAQFAGYGVQQLWEIELSRNGVRKALFATSDHRWFVRGRKSAVLTRQLVPGQRLETVLPSPLSDWTLDAEGVRHGIMFGDGTLYDGIYGTLNLHGAKDAELARWFPDQSHHPKTRENDRPYLRIYGGRAFGMMKQPPSPGSSAAYRLGFLAGYLAADGHVAKDGTVMLNSARPANLAMVRDVAESLGIATYGITKQMRRGYAAEDCALYRIHFVTSTLSPAFFLLSAARSRFEARAKKFDRLRWTVVSVARSDRHEEVYCAEVPDTHAFALDDNILTGNCFGCGAHGDAIRFLTDAKGLPFMDAVKELAGKAGLDVPAADPRERDKSERSADLTDVMASAQKYFAEQLAGSEGGEARRYLTQRGIDATTIARFGLGLAPNGRGKLKTALLHLGEDKLVDTGMLIRPEEENKDSYDRFRGRIMFPIRDQRGRVIAFGGRILGDGEPKYLNSPETILFDKGRTLYNIDRAGPASRKANRLIVVEGYMDVIALDRAGIAEVIAPNGTALTEAQLDRLWRLDPTPILCFDGDNAGIKAAVRAAQRALPHLGAERTLRFVALPAGQDPDDVVKSGGKQAIEELLAAAEPLVERLWRHERDFAPLDTPEARAGLKQRLMDHAATIGDGSLKQLYRDEWLSRFDALVRPQRGGGSGGGGGGKFTPRIAWKKNKEGRFVPPEPPPGVSVRAIGASGTDRATARALVLGHALFPAAIPDHVEAFAALPIPDAAAATVRDRLLDLAMAGAPLDRAAIATILHGQDTAAAWRDLSKGGDIGFSFTRGDCDPDIARRDLGSALEALAATAELAAALAAATDRFKADMSDEAAFAQQQRLHEQREAINQRLANLAGNE